MRSRFDEQLSLLNRKMIEMGARCEELITQVATALLEGDVEGARIAKVHGQEIDQMERTKLEIKNFGSQEEKFMIFALLAIVSLLLEILLRNTILKTIP